MRKWSSIVALVAALALAGSPYPAWASTAGEIQSEHETAKAARDAAQVVVDEALATFRAAEQAVTDAKNARDLAKVALDNARENGTTAEIRAARKVYNDAVADLRAKRNARDAAHTVLTDARQVLSDAQEVLDGTVAGATIEDRTNARIAMNVAEDTYDASVVSLADTNGALTVARSAYNPALAARDEAQAAVDTQEAQCSAHAGRVPEYEATLAGLNAEVDSAQEAHDAQRAVVEAAAQAVVAARDAWQQKQEESTGSDEDLQAIELLKQDYDAKLAARDAAIADAGPIYDWLQNRMGVRDETQGWLENLNTLVTDCQTTLADLTAVRDANQATLDPLEETLNAAVAAQEIAQADHEAALLDLNTKTARYAELVELTSHSTAKVLGLQAELDERREVMTDVKMGCVPVPMGDSTSPTPAISGRGQILMVIGRSPSV